MLNPCCTTPPTTALAELRAVLLEEHDGGKRDGLPRESMTEIAPRTTDRVQAGHDVLPDRYRLPLDATGRRLGEREAAHREPVSATSGQKRPDLRFAATRLSDRAARFYA